MDFKTKQDQVAEILRERIISGAYRRGEKLRQLEIAEELGVSATPVREALRILEAEGYIISLSHRGVLVPPFSVEKSQELFELRLLLEGQLTRLALMSIKKENIEELNNLNEEYNKYVDSGDRLSLRAANYRFHFRLYALANRPQTIQFVRVLWAKYPFHYLDRISERVNRVANEHWKFIQCLERNDHEGCIKAMTDHIRNGWDEFSKQKVESIASQVKNSEIN